MRVVGYCDPLGVAPGESIRFMVSCLAPSFEAQVVRLVHGDLDQNGPGYKEHAVEATINGVYPGRVQELRPGSYAEVPDESALRDLQSFAVRVAVFATAPGGAPQAIISKWSAERGGFSLELDDCGVMELVLADSSGFTERVSVGVPMRRGTWYRVGLSYDCESATVALVQQPVRAWPLDSTAAVRRAAVGVAPALDNGARLAFAARNGGEACYNGKLSGPTLYARALAPEALAATDAPEDALAVWQLGLDSASTRVVDIGNQAMHAELVNMPMRGVTGPGWTGHEMSHLRAPAEYDAIHFHDDDLDDARWEPDVEWVIPERLQSGIYALRLRSGAGEDYVPFYVRPAAHGPRASIAFLVPVFSHLAYANEHYLFDPEIQATMGGDIRGDIRARLAVATEYERQHYLYAYEQRLLSLYDHHSDGSGCCYASRRRPLVNMRPKYNWPTLSFEAPHQFNEDLCLVDWLEEKNLAYDVLTDEDLHREGETLLRPYRVVLTGSHPEYSTEAMLEGLQGYLDGGGRLMYLGGNGFYWVTSVDPTRPHVIEIRRGAAGSRIWEAAAGEYHHSTTGELGGIWRHRNRPPHRMFGVGFTGQGYDRSSPYRRLPDSHDPRARFVFEGVENDVIGDYGLHLGGAAGYEIDRCDVELGSPPHTLRLAESFGHSDAYQRSVEEVRELTGRHGATEDPRVRADMVLCEYPRGGAVFSVGSISWMGSLSHNGYENDVSRITENVLRRFMSSCPLPDCGNAAPPMRESPSSPTTEEESTQ